MSNSTKNTGFTVTFNKATIEDTELVLYFIKELAHYEKFPDKVTVTEFDLKNNLFSSNSIAETLICNVNGKPCGFAVYYKTFSTTTGRPGMHLDDLFILPEYQNMGLGTLFLSHLSGIAKKQGCARFEWWTLKSNVGAQNFYRHLGARIVDEISVFRLDSKGIENLKPPAI